MPIQVTTNLPNAQAPTLGNGVEDEVQVDWTDVINYGHYDIQYRTTGSSTWIDWSSPGEATTSDAITGLDDGEEYEVRMRTETEHVTGAWTTPVDIITKFPGVTNFSSPSHSTNTVDFTWTDNADSEDGTKVFRAENVDGTWTVYTELADLAPNTTSYTDSSPQPDTTYRYYVRPYTEHTSVDSSTVDVTTNATGRPQRRSKSRGWYAEVDHPNGRTIALDIIGEPVRRPQLNGLPRVEIPVPRNESWQSPKFEGATMRVFYNGREAPIDELIDVTMKPDHTRLVGRGGVEMLDRVTVEYDNQEAWIALRDLVNNNTSYTANIDDPATTTQNDTLMQEAATESELSNNVNGGIAATDPFETQNGKLVSLQTCFTAEGEDATTTNATGWPDAPGTYSDENAIWLQDTGDYAEWEFTVDYTIPASAVGVKVRDGDGGSAPNAFEWTLNGDQMDYLTTSASGLVFGWHDVGSGNYNGDGYTGTDLTPGTYTLRVEVTDGETSSDQYLVDVVAPYDTRFNYFFDDDNGGNGGYLDGPELYPDGVDIVFEDATTAQNVVGGKVDTVMNDTSGSQALALSNDQGTSYSSASNVSTYSTSFSSGGGSIRTRVTLSRFGSRSTATPQTGFNAQSLDSYKLYADLEDSPVIVNKRYDGQLIDVLSEIGDYGNFVVEFQRDGSTDTVEGTQPGLRSAQGESSIADYSVRKKMSERYEEAVIYGSAQQWNGERFTSNHGTYVALDNDFLLETGEVVYDPSAGTLYDRGSDYVMDYQNGQVQTLSTGAMADATEYAIDYRFKTKGTYTSSAADGSLPTLVETIPALTTDRGCDTAALQIIQKVSQPLYTAEVVLPERPPTFELIDSLALDDLPTDDNTMVIYDMEQKPGNTLLHLGSRQRVREVVSQIANQVSGVSGRV